MAPFSERDSQNLQYLEKVVVLNPFSM